MNRLITLICLIPLAASAQTIALEGIVKTSSGDPLSNMSVAITRLPIDEAEDVTSSTLSDAAGRFRFEKLAPGKYNIAATSDSFCGGAVTLDLSA